MRTSFILLPVLLAASVSYGTDGSLQAWDLALEDLLPEEEGFIWRYWGFAEYGHWMHLDEIEETGDGTVYRVSGMVEDMSAGEATGDFSISLEYTVSDSVLSVVQRSPMAMDNDFMEMELLRLPISEGNRWSQTAVDMHGAEVRLVCGVEEVGERTVTVRYSMPDSPFYQLRVFEEGMGVVTFEKLYISPDGNFEVGYTLFRESDFTPDSVPKSRKLK